MLNFTHCYLYTCTDSPIKIPPFTYLLMHSVLLPYLWSSSISTLKSPMCTLLVINFTYVMYNCTYLHSIPSLTLLSATPFIVLHPPFLFLYFSCQSLPTPHCFQKVLNFRHVRVFIFLFLVFDLVNHPPISMWMIFIVNKHIQ